MEVGLKYDGRHTTSLMVRDVFGVTESLSIEGFNEPGELTPDIDQDISFSATEVMWLAKMIDVYAGEPIPIMKRSGIGERLAQYFERLNYEVIPYNGEDSLREAITREAVLIADVTSRDGLYRLFRDKLKNVSESSAFKIALICRY